MKKIKLPVYDIEIELEEDSGGEYKYSCGIISSNLVSTEDNDFKKASLEAIESFVLNCAMEDLDVQDPSFIEALMVTVQGIEDNY